MDTMEITDTKDFTPRQYQVELLAAAKEHNIIVCLENGPNRIFIFLKLILEVSNAIRRPFRNGGKRTLFITNFAGSVEQNALSIRHLTDLRVGEYVDTNTPLDLKNHQVLVMTSEAALWYLSNNKFKSSDLNLLILEDCHNAIREHSMKQIMKLVSRSVERKGLKVLGLTSSLVPGPGGAEPGRLEAEIQRLEAVLHSSAETAGDLVSILRYCAKPRETVLECDDYEGSELSRCLQEQVDATSEFLADHRYNPSEIYDKFREELVNIPDPKEEPNKIISDFQDILSTMGPWCADKAAYVLLMQIEKLKAKTPHERHFLLLCMVSTLMLKIRALCDDYPQGLEEKEKIYKFSSPKILRLIEAIRNFKPKSSPEAKCLEIENTETKSQEGKGTNKSGSQEDMENFCAIVLVENPFTAKILFHLFNELRECDPDFAFLSPKYLVSKVADPVTEPKEADYECQKQEEVLKSFRMRECNILISTPILKEFIDLPKCNLVVRYDVPKDYRSYAQAKGRAQAQDSHFLLMVEKQNCDTFISNLAKFIEIERMLLARCTNREPTEEEEAEADRYNSSVPAFCPGTYPVTMGSAIAVVNRYCANLPSDAFTCLTPLWSTHDIEYQGQPMHYCTVRLPINSPVKHDIIGHPMPTRVLAKRMAALETCQVLYKAQELDENLRPVGKESLMSVEEEDEEEEAIPVDSLKSRPDMTKQRQHYYKRMASSLSNCRPVVGQGARLYQLQMLLTCPLPEEHNTLGRKLHPPEDAPQGFGILTLKQIPKICPFPIFTRSGEVRVSLELRQEDLHLTQSQLEMITTFHKYTFTNVLRLQKYLMQFDPNASESYMIVPTKKGMSKTDVEVDWEFLELINSRREEMPHYISDKERQMFVFDAEKYHDAVVMKSYRNQDHPEYYYVEEICSHLNPKSSFPDSNYQTFEEYYKKKYGITIQNSQQPLLDVDPTSARLKFLMPRYMNRIGVVLQTSSEMTKRAKSDLSHKQILLPELCMVHPFPASLWRQAVCLPCVLYRVNSLLLADEIRTTVASEIGLGLVTLPSDFEWQPLDFGWSLADALKKYDKDDGKDNGPLMEIGTWSNEMTEIGDDFDPNAKLPANLTTVRYGSPTSWDWAGELCLSDMESNPHNEAEISDQSSDSGEPGEKLWITFKSYYLAEAEDDDFVEEGEQEEWEEQPEDWQWQENKATDLQKDVEREMAKFEKATRENKEKIENSGMLVRSNTPFIINREAAEDQLTSKGDEKQLGYQLASYAMPPGLLSETNSNTAHLECAGVSLDSCSEMSRGALEGEVKESGRFSFDWQPDLSCHSGPSPSVLLQALTMNSANDGISLERLETLGDSFLKYAVSTYLYCSFEAMNEGKLSYLRSKQVSNLNLYRLGCRKQLGESMIATKFEPHENWLPPCYTVPQELEQAFREDGLPAALSDQDEPPAQKDLTREQERPAGVSKGEGMQDSPSSVPYNLITQQSIPDKSIADCVEALIGAYLTACGPRGALLFMSWLGIQVLPYEEENTSTASNPQERKINENIKVVYGELRPPRSPLLRHVANPEGELEQLLDGYDVFEHRLKYRFRDRSYLLQAMTHASYSPNRLTDCYQRLEFLGDAVLDYLITRHLYEDARQLSPGELTDLRSALVNNTIFALIAVRHGFHKYFRHLSPGLAEIVERFVRIQEENHHAISEEYYMIGEECEEAEDMEVPKALGDLFESVAGAIFLDSGMSLDAVWKVYYRMMKTEFEQFSKNVPKSPVQKLLELEPGATKFGLPEKLADGKGVRVTVEVFGKGVFKGIGRTFRIAKFNAAKCALKHLKKRGHCT